MNSSHAANLDKHSATFCFKAALPAAILLLTSAAPIMFLPHSASAQAAAFGTPKQIVGNPAADAEPPQIATSAKNAYLVWHEFPINPAGTVVPDIFFSRSTNSGATFSPRVNLSKTAAADSSAEQIDVSGNTVSVVWVETDAVSFQSEIVSRTSIDGGISFKPIKVLSGTGNPNTPRIAVSGSNVFVAWQADGQAGNPDIFFAQSTNSGSSFGSVKNISNNAGISEFRDQGLRQMVVSDKKVIVTWRDDSVPNTGFEIFFGQGK